MKSIKTNKEGPKGTLLAGNLIDFRKDPLHFLNDLRLNYERVAKIRFANRQIYMLMSPDLIKEALVTKSASFEKSKAFKEINPLVGEGLLTSEGEFHLRQRRMMQPSFKKTHIKLYADQMSKVAIAAIEEWQVDEERNLHADMMNIALGIISKTMFSMDMKESHQTIGAPIDEAIRIATKRIRSLMKIPKAIPTKENQQFKESLRILNEVVYGIISHRREANDAANYDDLLGILMKATDETDHTHMTDKQLRDEVMTIFLAGHETTANAMSWALYLLAQHPDIQANAQTEIDQVVGDSQIRIEHTEQLTYLRNVINETLRLYPPAWMFGREATCDVQIGENLVKAGQNVMVSPYITHRLEEYYQDPNIFQPERFEKDFLRSIPTYAFFPFGGGPRVCIGNHFAMLEATIVLATVLQKYTVSPIRPNQKVEAEPLITLRPKGGVVLRVVRR
ncbi:cytochrome P450 [Halalkalibacter flavus]|uniref:cytochrome P450 n=1 Tax=Halalkalibacter flavus TaxID=3090668 RepID=UPI002FC7326E